MKRFLRGTFAKRDGTVTDRYGPVDTWTCHICKDERPDAQISVVKHAHRTKGDTDYSMTENVRYCNDRESCFEGAMLHCLLGKPEEHQ